MNIAAIAQLALDHAARQVDQAAEGVRRVNTIEADLPEVTDQADISTEALRLLAGRTAFQAGVALAKAASDMQQQAIDLLG